MCLDYPKKFIFQPFVMLSLLVIIIFLKIWIFFKTNLKTTEDINGKFSGFVIYIQRRVWAWDPQKLLVCLL